ncbi:hypothetical protein M406DRAFT_66208 [Cryphonectria parasitica EP155]|uniref:Uncharacterized protein n=1 Tax=Cryphonectria parasitica (strain ATCC 38755 / EP155) TaxID=660469 RepID=A0A9P4YB15_CRYP1|nr:uncharacterized protein M406DRAFT_66208 [Cryphonectria parasitica EP155]KAF3769735.1 hypothetical protein M406DRAFT_66208 [Cryphonectria parasitica EP155]
MAQVPDGAAGAAAGVLIWSSICFLSNCLFIWLLWGAQERRSFIFYISWITLLATATSIISQANDCLHYKDIMWTRLSIARASPGSPVPVATNGCTGVDLAMAWIRWSCYVAEAGLACSWASNLTAAVYGWNTIPRVQRHLNIISELGKVIPIMAVTGSMCLLYIWRIQQSYWWYYFVVNFCYCFFLIVADSMMFLILIEYLQTHLLLRRMNHQQRRDYVCQASDIPTPHSRSDSEGTSIFTTSRSRSLPGSHFGALQQREGGIYDKYLIVRTFTPLLMLSFFEVFNIMASRTQREKFQQLAQATAPDLSASTARAWFASYIPGCLASLVLPLAFATTRNFSERLYLTFVPEHFQSSERRRKFWHASELVYAAMDNDKGILSRQKRLLMEDRLQIEVTYEFEVRSEKPASREAVAEVIGKGGSASYPYNVEDHKWGDTERILPRRPSVSFVAPGRSSRGPPG